MLKRHAGHTSPVPGTVKSPVKLARLVYRTAQEALDEYSSPVSRHDFTQAQLFTLLVLRTFFRIDYRGLLDYVEDFSDLRQVLDLEEKLPHHTTLVHAEARLLKKRPAKLSKTPYFDWLGVLDASGELTAPYAKAS